MSKAENFISDCTRNCSNAIYDPYDTGDAITIYAPWLTPDHARKAVEIAREEIYEWLNENARLYIELTETIFGRIKVFNTDKFIKDLKQAIKDE